MKTDLHALAIPNRTPRQGIGQTPSANRPASRSSLRATTPIRFTRYLLWNSTLTKSLTLGTWGPRRPHSSLTCSARSSELHTDGRRRSDQVRHRLEGTCSSVGVLPLRATEPSIGVLARQVAETRRRGDEETSCLPYGVRAVSSGQGASFSVRSPVTAENPWWAGDCGQESSYNSAAEMRWSRVRVDL